ncbi:MAG: HNH endonuclease, partial [Acidimicrobiales bacterium]|nr:HNH endonuclease [Acidimicrobiales bacterium]
IDSMEQELIRLEGLISRVRARQVEILSAIDRLQVPYWDGTRSLKEWISGRLDIQPRNASDLATLAKTQSPTIRHSLRAGVVSVDRAAATARLENSGADQQLLDQADGVAVAQVHQLAARHHRTTPVDETTAFRMRRLWFQPNLGNTVATGTFTMTGTDMELVLDAIDQRADAIIDPYDPHRPRLEQRRIDALVSMALDTITPQDSTAVAPRRLKAHIFVDAGTSSHTNGEAGSTTRSGIKVGPNTLQEILCIGETQTTLVATDGLKVVPTNGDRLPQRTRDYVFYRDRACTADGCTSRYRLEPHHVQARSHGGSHEPDNLTLLCWFHHHVVIHQEGFHIDPHSPPCRRRFLPPVLPPVLPTLFPTEANRAPPPA